MTIGSSAVHAPLETDASRSAPLTVLIAVPTLDAGAADLGAVDLARILVSAGHHPIVVSSGGRLESIVAEAGGEIVHLNMASRNPMVMARNARRLVRLVRERRCDVIHAHGRGPGWSAYIAARVTGVPFLTSWYKGFREQNIFKRLYNSVLARGDRVIAVSDQIAEMIVERHATPWDRIAVIPSGVDPSRYDPASVSSDRVEAVRRKWGVKPNTRVILVTGRMLRRKGHDVVVRAMQRLKERGLKDFTCIFIGEDLGRTRYSGELWDHVMASGATEMVRLMGPVEDRPAAYAAANVVVSASIQAEGLQRAILEALAMARPVIASDLGAGPEVIQSPPMVPEERMTGLRVPAGDDAALAAALIRLLSLPETARRAIGMRGRDWVIAHFDPATITSQMLAIYARIGRRRR